MQTIRKSAVLLTLLAACATTPSWAGPYSDDLAKCLVRSTTSKDKTVLVQWMFAMASLNSDVKQLSAVTTAQRTELHRRFADMVQILLTKSCLKETRDAVQYEGPSTLETSFNVLGQVAGRELFADPNVAGGMKELEGMLDIKSIQREIGITK
jgi:hypothetical protein